MKKLNLLFSLILASLFLIACEDYTPVGETETGETITQDDIDNLNGFKEGELDLLPTGNYVELERSDSGSISLIYKLKGSKSIETFRFYEHEIEKGLLLLEKNNENINEIYSKNGVVTLKYHSEE